MASAVEQAPSTHGARVLLAGADHVIQTHMEQLLTRSGYEVIVAQNDGEARHVFESSDPPKLAVLDWDMPGGGIELCRQLRHGKRHRDAYLILLTHWNDPNERVQGLEAGADDCLFKPVDVRELRIRLHLGTQTILERALRESEERFRSAFECAGIGMALVKVTGEIIQINQSLCSFLGYSAEELQQRNFHDLGYPEDTPGSRDLLQQVLEGTHRSHEFERRFITRRGLAWASLTLSSVLDADQHSTSFLVQVQDIAQRKAAEANLRAAHAETELFLQTIPSILIGLDAEGRITRWNPVAASTLGIPFESAVGRTIDQCGINWLQPRIKDEVARWLQTTASRACEDLTFARNKRVHSLGLHIRRIPTEKNEGTVLLVTGADTTERKTLEEQLRQAQKLEAIGQLSAGIAHEINTPTQYVGDNIRFLKESWTGVSEVLQLCETLRREHATKNVRPNLLDQLDEICERSDIDYLLKEVPHAVDHALEGVRRVAKIVRAMKEFSHPGEEEKREIDLNRAIETTVTVAHNEWKYVADVCLHLDESLPMVCCHVGELNQAILNLIVNAAHAVGTKIGDDSEAKGRITISTGRHGNCAEIAIADTGSGIPEAIRSRIFEPFFTTKPLGQGTGQGLALAHSVVVNRHQGQIWFESALEKGTTFFIRLPFHPGAGK
ncbi:MAG TPA: PAS domain S-box protein [Terriglobales bacterium]|nr:PAS domain S-box protein [Terriglobales bacterium]